MVRETVVISPRFRGPPQSGNGGYTCGLLARPLKGAVEAWLKIPPPLDSPLTLQSGDGRSRLLKEEALVGEAREISGFNLDIPAVPGLEEAGAASKAYIGFQHHPFAGCFVCGPERTAGDGLCIFPGRLPEGAAVACVWTPDASLANEDGVIDRAYLWAALDCPSYFALEKAGQMVALLGRLTAGLDGNVRPGEPVVVMAWPLGHEGRKHYSATALFDREGARIASARAVWIEIESK